MSATSDTAHDGTTTTPERVASHTDAHRSSAGRPSKLQKSPPATPAAPRDSWGELVSRMRREFFARGRESAARYGVTFDDVLAHAIRADLPRTPGPGRVLSYVDDLVVAAACASAHPRAWHDAWTKYESTLIRAARTRLREADAVIFARRYWRELHASTSGGATTCPSLAGFSGVRPAAGLAHRHPARGARGRGAGIAGDARAAIAEGVGAASHRHRRRRIAPRGRAVAPFESENPLLDALADRVGAGAARGRATCARRPLRVRRRRLRLRPLGSRSGRAATSPRRLIEFLFQLDRRTRVRTLSPVDSDSGSASRQLSSVGRAPH
jgi:hypothetical protein